MKPAKKYKSAAALRTALESRLNRLAEKEKGALARLRRQFVFDRFLCRVFHGEEEIIMLKGGYAMELRIHEARTTRDIDLCMKKGSGRPPSPETLHAFFQNKASLDLGDYLEFVVQSPSRELTNMKYGGFRFPIAASMAGREFTRFSIDVAVGDVWLDDRVLLKPRDWLEFAGVSSLEFPAVTVEQQLAEKYHSYTMPRSRPNSRVKDLVDILLMLDAYDIGKEKMRRALTATFRHRKTHSMPDSIAVPSEAWSKVFDALSRECGIKADLSAAYKKASDFWNASK